MRLLGDRLVRPALNDAYELPHGLVLLDLAELLDVHVLADDAVQVVSDEVNDHQVLGDFLCTSRQHLLRNRTRDTWGLAHCALDRAQLAYPIGRAGVGEETLWRRG